ncbi:ER membrane protein complex subunit 10 [Scaptodrosophila lebanonensis]|uniref:ER membrane protein complex subunit 10 n=1 Tax=Drosophila lebanonensis TaxID=7225 RepID=A0A6J2U759_DROLE|nr:ER membrane protein complex subunit 10 [Scaptodrosophila lebanonensis]
MMYNYFIVICFLLCAANCGWSYLEQDSWTNVELHHGLSSDPEHFSFRGNVTIPSLNSALSSLHQIELKTSELNVLTDLARQNGFYRLKVTVMYPNGKKQIFLTSSKACSLLQSELNDILWISVGPSGFISSVTHTSLSDSIECDVNIIEHIQGQEYNTDVLVKHSELAPMPDTAGFIQKVEREREARERGEVRDNRGFFSKYWMYIVPVVLLVFISGATNQDAAK